MVIALWAVHEKGTAASYYRAMRSYETLPSQIFIRLAVVDIAICIFILLIHLNFVPRLFTILHNAMSAGAAQAFIDTTKDFIAELQKTCSHNIPLTTAAHRPAGLAVATTSTSKQNVLNEHQQCSSR